MGWWTHLPNETEHCRMIAFARSATVALLQVGLLVASLDANALTAQTISFPALSGKIFGAAPFTVDLETQIISGPGGPDIAFTMPAADRMRLLEGLDDIGLTLKHADEIGAWERRMASLQPWLQTMQENRS